MRPRSLKEMRELLEDIRELGRVNGEIEAEERLIRQMERQIARAQPGEYPSLKPLVEDCNEYLRAGLCRFDELCKKLRKHGVKIIEYPNTGGTG